jgi:hypothetical protein
MHQAFDNRIQMGSSGAFVIPVLHWKFCIQKNQRRTAIILQEDFSERRVRSKEKYMRSIITLLALVLSVTGCSTMSSGSRVGVSAANSSSMLTGESDRDPASAPSQVFLEARKAYAQASSVTMEYIQRHSRFNCVAIGKNGPEGNLALEFRDHGNGILEGISCDPKDCGTRDQQYFSIKDGESLVSTSSVRHDGIGRVWSTEEPVAFKQMGSSMIGELTSKSFFGSKPNVVRYLSCEAVY